jgi:cobalamin biosynthesis protein CobC
MTDGTLSENAAFRHGGEPAAYRHGGDLTAAQAAFPDAPQPWIDLSTGINPWPYPVPPVPAQAWARLPGKAAEDALRRAAAAAFAVPGDDMVLAAPGTQALIQLLPRLTTGANTAEATVAVLSPTYAEHAAAWRAAGRQAAEVSSLAQADADIVVVVNPNNPDGRVIDTQTLLRRADAQADLGGFLIVDEAFADMTPQASVAPHVGRPGLLVLRSFGKFFGLAGARLGFLLAEPALIRRAAAMLGPWAVSGPALTAGAAAYSDTAWIAGTRANLAAAAARLDDLLIKKGYRVVGGTSLFRLIDCNNGRGRDGAALFERLARAGIWSRPFINLPACVRLGLPPDDAAFARLADAL